MNITGSLPKLRISGFSPEIYPTSRQEWKTVEGEIGVSSYRLNSTHWISIRDFGCFRFETGSHEVAAHVPAETNPDTVNDWFVRLILPLYMYASGMEVLHAGASVIRDGVVALCGISGSGKSTLAYALSCQASGQWADDTVVVEAAPQILAIPMPFAVRLSPGSPALSAGAALNTDAPGVRNYTTPLPLHAIFLLRRSSEPAPPQIRRLPPAEAVSCLLPHAFCLDLEGDAARKRRMMENYLTVCDRVGVFELSYGSGLSALQETVRAILNAVA